MSTIRKRLGKPLEQCSDSFENEPVENYEKLKKIDATKDNSYFSQLDAFSHELKLLLAQIEIISAWIKQKFGVELFDRESLVLHHVSDFGEIEEIAGILSTTVTLKGSVNKAEKSLESVHPVIDIFDSGTDGEHGTVDTKNEERIDEREDGDNVTLVSTLPELKTPKTRKSPKKQKTVSPNASPSKSAPKKGTTRTSASKPLVTYQCDECGKVLATSANLREHQKIHGDIRPYSCELCGKSFRRSQKLKLHLLIHKGEEGKTHQCRFCGRLFIQRRDLNRHERTHTGEKPYQCPHCPKSFNVNQHLIYHIRTHTGEKPYKCDLCTKSFAQPNTLRLHRKLHEGIKYIAPSRLKKRKAKLASKILVEEKMSSTPPAPVKELQVHMPAATTQSNLKKFFITIPAHSLQHQANTLSVTAADDASNTTTALQPAPPQTTMSELIK